VVALAARIASIWYELLRVFRLFTFAIRLGDPISVPQNSLCSLHDPRHRAPVALSALMAFAAAERFHHDDFERVSLALAAGFLIARSQAA